MMPPVVQALRRLGDEDGKLVRNKGKGLEPRLATGMRKAAQAAGSLSGEECMRALLQLSPPDPQRPGDCIHLEPPVTHVSS